MQRELQTVYTLIEEQSDLGLHCLPKPVCPKTQKLRKITVRFLQYCILWFRIVSYDFREMDEGTGIIDGQVIYVIIKFV